MGHLACQLVLGWFEDTLQETVRNEMSGSIVLAFVDIDLEASLNTCVQALWPALASEGSLFINEAVNTDYCAISYSERWWRDAFDQTPPGLIGAGTGLPLGTYYIGPLSARNADPLQHQGTGAYTDPWCSGV